MANETTYTPTVDETREFLEIANDFANPLDLVREAISNSFDANAEDLSIIFDTVDIYGESTLRITISDDGEGMDEEGIRSFFDLGNSKNREDPDAIGEKGHGTKVYFNSKKVEVTAIQDGVKRYAELDQPIMKLHENQIPEVKITKEQTEEESGTEIIIKGYRNNRRKHFTHDRLKDHILWFTKFGSIETQFDIDENEDVTLSLKGLDEDDCEEIDFGHPFPDESDSVEELFDEYLTKAPGHYCRKFIYEGNLENHPEVDFQAVFSIEGKYVKYDSNPMIKRPGYQSPDGAYNVRERYGLWLCKDHIPIQRKNIWITEGGRGFEFTRFHAFVNCQSLKLTANRGSVDNTEPEILVDLKNKVQKIHKDITETDDWNQLEWLEQVSESERTINKEEKEFETRWKAVKRSNMAKYEDEILIEPNRESGVYGLVIQLMTLHDDIFPFEILSYDTQSGIDLLVTTDQSPAEPEPEKHYVELKHILERGTFNHSFRFTHSIICWDIDIGQGEIIQDIRDQERRLDIVDDTGTGYTRYLLAWPNQIRKIEVYVLKDYLKEKFDIEFRPRSEFDS